MEILYEIELIKNVTVTFGLIYCLFRRFKNYNFLKSVFDQIFQEIQDFSIID